MMRANAGLRPVYRLVRSRIFVFTAVAVLAHFATSCTQWSHPAKGQREYNTDSSICWRAADESGETEYWPHYHVYKACMVGRGWVTD